MKSPQNATLLSDGAIFFSFRNIEWYTALLSTFSFPKKGEKLRLKFQIVNLGNGGTKDFWELWEIMHLKI